MPFPPLCVTTSGTHRPWDGLPCLAWHLSSFWLLKEHTHACVHPPTSGFPRTEALPGPSCQQQPGLESTSGNHWAWPGEPSAHHNTGAQKSRGRNKGQRKETACACPPRPYSSSSCLLPSSGTLELPLHTPNTAVFGPSHAHTICAPPPPEAGAGASPAQTLESGPSCLRCVLEEGLVVGSRWAYPGLGLPKHGTRAGLPLPGSGGCSGRALYSLFKNFLTRG